MTVVSSFLMFFLASILAMPLPVGVPPLPEDPALLLEYLRSDSYEWGYEAVGHRTAGGTANVDRG